MLSRAKCQGSYWIIAYMVHSESSILMVEVLLLQAVAAKFSVYFRARDDGTCNIHTTVRHLH